MVDIVVPSIRDLDFLEDWKPFVEPFHIIIIQDGDPAKKLKIPDWADYELYNRHDIEKALGDKAWIISSKDASIRNFGFLVSDKDFIYTLDDQTSCRQTSERQRWDICESECDCRAHGESADACYTTFV
jgi:reversibly glycosylated polypeptide/UDP-arabinopyranose mutase